MRSLTGRACHLKRASSSRHVSFATIQTWGASGQVGRTPVAAMVYVLLALRHHLRTAYEHMVLPNDIFFSQMYEHLVRLVLLCFVTRSLSNY
jgi:hypothetical protein